MARTKYGLFGSHHAVFQRGHCEERFHRGARRIGAPQRAVDQRLVDVVLQDIELLGGEAARECIGVESGRAGESHDVAGIWVDGDGGAALALQGVFRGALHAHVEA